MKNQKIWIVISSTGLLAATGFLVYWHSLPLSSMPTKDRGDTASHLSPTIPAGAMAQETLPSDRVDSALAAIRNETDPIKREAETQAFLDEVAPSDIPGILQTLEDPKDDMAKELRLELAAGLAGKWAKADPTNAFAWAQKLPDGDDRDEVLSAVSAEVTRTNPLLALKLATGLPEGSTQDNMIAQAASEWATTDPKSAFGWAGQIDDEPLRQRVVAAVITQWADQDPTAAAAAALKSLPEGRTQDDAVISVVERMTQKDPQQAAAWVAQFSGDDEFRRTAVENVVKLWPDKNAGQLETWLHTLSSGSLRDSAVATYAGKMALSSPSEAEQWASSIANDSLRNQEMETVAENWLTRDPANARAWIEQGLLPADVRARLLIVQ